MTQADVDAAEDAVVTAKMSVMTDDELLRLSRLAEGVLEQRAVLSTTPRRALRAFADVVDAAGGLIEDTMPTGFLVPAGAPEWTDLSDAYYEACRVLNREPLTGEPNDEGDEDGDEEEEPEVSDR